jgi:hypothetical protein
MVAPRKRVQEGRRTPSADRLLPRAFVVLFLVLGTIVPSTIARSEEPATACVDVDISSFGPSSMIFADGFELGDTTAWLSAMPAFSATEILDVVFEVEIENGSPGEHRVELEIYTPNGHVYRVLASVITIAAAKDGSEVPVAALASLSSPGRSNRMFGDSNAANGVVLDLPVAGTLIVTNSLYGIWEVKPSLGGESAACTTGPIRFNLVQ